MTNNTNNRFQKTLAAAVVVIAIVGFGKYLWYEQVYLKPQNVFWSTIDQNLQTGSIKKTNTQKNSELQSITQATTIQYKGAIIAHTKVTIQDKTKGSQSLVVTDTFGTTTQDFLRYTQIKSDQTKTPSNTVGLWAVNTKSDKQKIQILSDALLSSPIMFGYLNSNKRTELINQMKNNQVFNIDYSKVNKNDNIDGKKVYSYKISINLQKYISVYKEYLAMIGQADIANQLGQPQNDSMFKATLYISPISRHPLKMVSDDATNAEMFSDFDINRLEQPPKDIKLPILELQKRLAG